MATKYDLNLRDYWRVIRRRKFIIVFTTVALGAFSFLFSIISQPAPLYQAAASVKVEQSGSVTGLYVQTVSWSQTDYMQTQAAIIKSYYIVEAAAKSLNLIPSGLPSEEVRASKKYQGILMNLRKSVETEQEGYSNIINIMVTTEDPVFAQRLANTIARVYKERHVRDLNKRAFEAKKFIENQLTVIKKKLRDAEDAVRKFREENNLISLSAQTSTMLNQMAALKVASEKAKGDYQKIKKVQGFLERAKNKPLTSETSFYINEASSLYKNLNDRLVQLMLKRDSLLLVYTEDYPQIVEINKQVLEIVKNMSAQLSSQEKTLADSIKDMKGRTDELDGQIMALPEKGLELARLEQVVSVNRQIYMLLEKKYQESLIQEAEKVEEVQIVKPALEPTAPINPPKTAATGAVGTLIGLILGLMFAFVVETFDTSIGAIEDVEEITGVNVLGIIPHVSLHDIKATILNESSIDIDDKTAERYTRIVSHFAPKSTLAESYRSLRTNLSFAGLEDNIKTIAFTSSSPREGKTTTVINLAVTLAQAGKKVLLIDGDMRKPVVASVFGIDLVPGLSDAILGNYSLDDAVRSVTDIMTGKMSMDDIMKTPGMDNLYILTSGTIPPNPSELAGSHRFAELIKEARFEYDMVLLDAPPLLSATDAAIYASVVDSVILVYRVGKIARAVLKRAKSQLDNVKAKVIGIVLNGIKADISPDFTRQDYYKYNYYYTAEDREKLAGSFLSKLLSIPTFVTAIFRKSPEKKKIDKSAPVMKDSGKKKEGKSLPVKSVILLITLMLLSIAVSYQMGYLKLPYPATILPANHGSDSFTKAIIVKPVIKKKVVSIRSESSKQQADIVVPGKNEIVLPVPPVEEPEPVVEPASHPVESTVVEEKSAAPEGGGSVGSESSKQQADIVVPGKNEIVLPVPSAEESEPVVEEPASHPASSPVESTVVEEKSAAPEEGGSAVDEIGTLKQQTEIDVSGKTEKTASASRYAVQVGSLRNTERAERLVSKLRSDGMEAYWIEFNSTKGEKWYVVLIGQFDKRYESVKFMREKKLARKYPGSQIFEVSSSHFTE
ncbi:MAG: polysaccharide biosynthesis tyrosine autokinase [Deltaproteobacteria bacterium]|nr:polysaccharide biosynthesis tyrosine autokinase [Deltaproteobacteria bacterium]